MELLSEDKYSSLADDVLVQPPPPPTDEVTEILFLALTRASVRLEDTIIACDSLYPKYSPSLVVYTIVRRALQSSRAPNFLSSSVIKIPPHVLPFKFQQFIIVGKYLTLILFTF